VKGWTLEDFWFGILVLSCAYEFWVVAVGSSKILQEVPNKFNFSAFLWTSISQRFCPVFGYEIIIIVVFWFLDRGRGSSKIPE